MSKQLSPSERLIRALTTPLGGVVGLVDQILRVSLEHDLRLSWQAGRCRVTILKADPADQFEAPLQKSVIRAVLARIAALCNKPFPNSVSPYGGLGEVTIDADPARVIRVKFINTLQEQSLELTAVPVIGNQQTSGKPLSAVIEKSEPFLPTT
jgi:hypothetical protein